MKKILLLISFLMVGASLSFGMQGGCDSMAAGPKHEKMGKMREMHKQNLFSKLDLTTEQKSKIDEIEKAFDLKTVDLRAKMEKVQIEKRDAMQKRDYAKAKSLVDNSQDVKKELIKLRIEKMESIDKILTTEQKEKLDKMKEEKRENGAFGKKGYKRCK